MPVVAHEEAAERPVEVVRLEDLDVRRLADGAPSNSLAALDPRGIEQTVVADAHEAVTRRRHGEHPVGVRRVQCERLLDVDVRAGADRLFEEREVRFWRRRDVDHIRPDRRQHPFEVTVLAGHAKAHGGLPDRDPGSGRRPRAASHGRCAAPRAGERRRFGRSRRERLVVVERSSTFPFILPGAAVGHPPPLCGKPFQSEAYPVPPSRVVKGSVRQPCRLFLTP